MTISFKLWLRFNRIKQKIYYVCRVSEVEQIDTCTKNLNDNSKLNSLVPLNRICKIMFFYKSGTPSKTFKHLTLVQTIYSLADFHINFSNVTVFYFVFDINSVLSKDLIKMFENLVAEYEWNDCTSIEGFYFGFQKPIKTCAISIRTHC